MSRWDAFRDNDFARLQSRLFLRYSGRINDKNSVWNIAPFTFEEITAHGYPMGGPALTLGEDEMDGFLLTMLELAWSRGLRPKGFADFTNEITAVRYHLEDMRTLAGLKKNA